MTQIVKSGALRRTLSGSGSPDGVITPRFVGEEYYDSSLKAWWKSRGETSGDWVMMSTPYGWWDDLKFPSTAVNPPGVAADPDWDTDTPGWLFDGVSTTEVLHFAVQLPHQWIGTNLRPHVHWMKTTAAAGNVRWLLEWKWAPIGETLDADWSSDAKATAVTGTPDNNTANRHLITAFAEIDATGKGDSDMLLVKLSRTPTHDDDTYGADARMLEFDIHLQLSYGTETEYPS